MSPQSLQQFHDDLRAAVNGQVVLDIGAPGSATKPLSTHEIDRLQEQLDAADVSVESSDAAAERAGLPARYVDAIKVFELLNLMSPVLDGLSRCPEAATESRAALRRTWAYIGLFLVAAFAGLYFYAEIVSPLIAEMRADSNLSAFKNQYPVEHFLPIWPAALPYIGVLLIILLIWGCTGGTAKLTQWLGGHRYTQLQLKHSAISTINLLTQIDVPLKQATQLSTSLNRLDARSKQEVEQLAANGVSYAVSSLPLIDYLAKQQLDKLKKRIPIVMVCVVGGVIGAAYAILIFQPLFDLLVEISEVAL